MITKTAIAKYTLLPGVVPRLFDLFRSGFAHIAYLTAAIYQGVRLLPPGHPYLDPRNFGRYGIRHVIAAAANNLEFRRNNIDQVVVFAMLLVGLILLMAQFAMFIFALTLSHSALAAGVGNPLSSTAMLGPPAAGPAQDIAFILLDRIFGVTGYFDSCISTNTACTDLQGNPVSAGGGAFPWPFHIALHRLFQFYSLGIFFVGVFVIIYFVTTIIAETAQSGTPFGQRFSRAWVPIRLMVFLALLIPFDNNPTHANGLNGGQLLLLKVVELGSNFATNGWVYFNAQAASVGSQSFLTQQEDLIAESNLDIQEIKNLLQFMSVVHTCRAVYHIADGQQNEIQGYIVRSPIDNNAYGAPPAGRSAQQNNALDFLTTSYATARDFSLKGDITLRFGLLAQVSGGVANKDFNKYRGQVKPLCGDLTFKVTDDSEPGSIYIQEAYYGIVQQIWQDTNFINNAKCIIRKNTDFDLSTVNLNCPNDFDETFVQNQLQIYHTQFVTEMQNGIAQQRAGGVFNVPPEIIERGWAGAAIWYNKIAEMNGAITSASLNIPQPSKLPFLMEAIFREDSSNNSLLNEENKFALAMSDIAGRSIRKDLDTPNEYDKFRAMSAAYNIWSDSAGSNSGSHTKLTGNIFIDFTNSILGTSGIFEMRKNANVHPLAQLSALGKSIMDAVMRNAAIGTSLMMGGGVLKMTTGFTGETATMAGNFFFSMVAMMVGIGVILHYVLPLMPFLYFMFAVSGWIKSIFEAMVAMPLWALAHLKIDGEGLPGPFALNGYMLVLEIFLRPILILTGLIAGISIFSALVGVLNIIFDLVVNNVAGFDTELDFSTTGGTGTGASRMSNAVGAIDTFFYTALYAILCYMIGLSCFKLVDMIPNQILRWMGSNATTFQESAGDPVGKLAGQVQRGSILITNQLRGRASGLAELG